MRYTSYSEYQGSIKRELTSLSYGPTGPIGPTGPTGNTGPIGRDGNFGGATFNYTFDISNNTNSGSDSYLKVDDISHSNVNKIGLSSNDSTNISIDSFMNTITSVTSNNKGYLRLSLINNSNIYSLFK